MRRAQSPLGTRPLIGQSPPIWDTGYNQGLRVFAERHKQPTRTLFTEPAQGVWSVRKSPLGHINTPPTSTFGCALSCLSAKLQASGVWVHFPLGHAH